MAKNEPKIEEPLESVEELSFTQTVNEPIIELYRKDLWSWEDHFTCSQCPFDTLDEDHMKRHIAETHYEKF